ncbi:MAG: acetyl/propionyl-CoA carboxylase alpha subunit, partial [Myxococcota bacterium]
MRFSKVAVLNRGECAVRFIRAARTWSRISGHHLDVVAFFTTPDDGAPFVRMASSSIALGAALVAGPDGAMRSAYLDIPRVIRLCKDDGVDALWPGWGFLAESPELADACVAAGITFIGPSAQAMRLLGDKEAGKRLAEANDVPVSDWSGGLVADVAEARSHADRIGYPVLLKATAGGGGRGIRVVQAVDGLKEAFDSASAEAAAAFGNAGLIVEEFVPTARHVEVQILADEEGCVWALGTRDCSLQRRHQKVIEEAPASNLPEGIEDRLCEAARSVARASGYVGAGTAEFLVSPDGSGLFFLEMNTRLQVEHTVTEAIYGVDLVAAQIDIALGTPLPTPEPPERRGWALEARLNAEDPDDGFSPAVGYIARFDMPQGPGIRVDSGFGAGDTVPSEFDSNLAKIIAWGPTRAAAWARLETALRDSLVAIEGGPTNRSLLIELVGKRQLREEAVTTRWLDGFLKERVSGVERSSLDVALAAAAIGDHLRARRGHLLNFHEAARKGLPRRAPGIEATPLRYLVGRVPVACEVSTRGHARYRIQSGSGALDVRARATGPRSFILTTAAGQRHSILRVATLAAVYIEVDGVAHRFTRMSDGRVRSTMPAAVTRVHVQPGEPVAAGDRLVTLEVMKMEMAVEAPLSGVVTDVHVDIASRVAAGDLIVTIEGASGADAGETASLELLPLADEGVNQTTPLETLRLALIGYDMPEAEIEAAIVALDMDPGSAARGALVQVLETAVAQQSLFQSGMYDAGRNTRGDSSTDQLAWFLQHLEVDDEILSERFLAHLRTCLASYGVTSLRRSFDLECALLRLFQARDAGPRVDAILFSAVSALVKAADDGTSVADETRLREVLESLANLAIVRNRSLARAVWSTIYLLCDRPRHQLVVRRQGLEGRALLTDLGDPDCSEKQREVARTDLLGMPLGTLLELLPASVAEPLHLRSSLLTILLERVYDGAQLGEALTLDPTLATTGQWLSTFSGQRVLGLYVGKQAKLPVVIKTLPDADAVDVFLGYEPDTDRLPALFAGVKGEQRISVIWGSGADGIRSRTYEFSGRKPTEVTLCRDLHPARAMALEVDRLVDFECTRLEAPGGLFLALAAARAGS